MSGDTVFSHFPSRDLLASCRFSFEHYLTALIELAVELSFGEGYAVKGEGNGLEISLADGCVDNEGGGRSELVVVSQMLVHEVGTLPEPGLHLIHFFLIVGPPFVEELAMVGIFGLDLIVHRLPHFPRAFEVQEVAHIDGHVVDKLAVEILVFHQTSEQAGSLIIVSAPVVAAVEFLPVEPVEVLVVVVVLTIEVHSVIHVLGDEAPATIFGAWAPEYDVIAGEVDVVVIDIHGHEVDKLLAIHPLFVFGHRVTMFVEESLEGIEVVPRAFLQVPPVLDEVHVFQPVVVGVNVVLVGAFSDV